MIHQHTRDLQQRGLSVLLFSIVVMNCSAFLASWKDKPGVNLTQRLPSSLLKVNNDPGVVSLDKAKLVILQGIVMELRQNEAIRAESPGARQMEHCARAPGLEEDCWTADERLCRVEGEIEQGKEYRADTQQRQRKSVASLTSELAASLRDVQILQGLLDQKQRDLETAQAQQVESMHIVMSLKEQLYHEKDKYSETMQNLRAQNEEKRNEIMVLRMQLNDTKVNGKERIEIAKAAVESAERRRTKIKEDLGKSERQRRRAQVIINLQRLVLKGLIEQQ